ncbi:MAG: DUF1583 domain-containing protein [Planctomycetota bacterium]
MIHHLRSLLSGESVCSETYFAPGETEGHPTIGDTAIGDTVIVLSDHGVRSRSLGPSPYRPISNPEFSKLIDVEPEWIGNGAASRPKADAWNTMKLTRKGDDVEISLNGEQVGRLKRSGELPLGFYRRGHHKARICNIVLTGDWPTEVPEDLLERLGVR